MGLKGGNASGGRGSHLGAFYQPLELDSNLIRRWVIRYEHAASPEVFITCGIAGVCLRKRSFDPDYCFNVVLEPMFRGPGHQVSHLPHRSCPCTYEPQGRSSQLGREPGELHSQRPRRSTGKFTMKEKDHSPQEPGRLAGPPIQLGTQPSHLPDDPEKHSKV